MLKKKYSQIFILTVKVLFTFLIAIYMIIYPQVAFKAALRGLNTWWNIVFPALLPFFVISEIFMGLGLVNFLGVLLEPIMRPVFNLPGSSAFAVAVGYTSGAPIGAVLTAKLRKQNLCSKEEASHLMAFTNNASPLFLFGAVAVGMFNNPALGSIIAGAHYLANLTVGLILRFHGNRKSSQAGFKKSQNKQILIKAFRALYHAHSTDGRPIGKLLGDAVKNSVQTLLLIGGFIIIFSVIIEILNQLGFLAILAKIFSLVLADLNIEPNLYHALACGFVEMTIGTKIVSETIASLEHKLLVTSLILGWLGLSVHAQAISMVADTDIDIKPYLFGRILHSALAGFWLIILLKFKGLTPTTGTRPVLFQAKPWLFSLYSLKNLGVSLLLLLMIAVGGLIINHIKYTRKILFFTSIYKKNK